MDNFYTAFEEKFRGPRELIKSRLEVYLPFVKPLLVAKPYAAALDLGCGRGEWLELLAENGFNPQGVDLDEGMRQACHDRGLKVHKSDAIEFLKSTPDASQCVVSGFHIAEHLPFDALKQLVIQAERVLVPGGLLILETPNPENISVGSNSFYLDPTHQRPIPPLLLNFISEHYGFARSKILRLQESPQLHQTGQALELMSVLDGVSPDYSVVAQKKGSDELAQLTNTAFEQDYGLTLHNLASRYQHQLAEQLNNSDVKDQLHQALSLAQAAQAQADQLNQQLALAQTQEQQTKEQLQQALSLAQAAQAQADQLNQQLALAHPQEQHIKDQLHKALKLAQSAQDQTDLLTLQLAHAQTQEQQTKEQLQQALSLALAMQSQGIEQAQQLQQLHQQALSKHDAEALAKLAQVQAELDQVHQSNHHHWTGLQKTQQELHNTHQANHHHWLQTQALQAQIVEIQNSWSWTLTAPLRWVAGFMLKPVASARALANQILGWGLNTFQAPLAKAMTWVLAKKGVSKTINRWLLRWPHLHAHLIAIGRRQGVLQAPIAQAAFGPALQSADSAAPESQDMAQQLAQLTPRARQIYLDLKQAIDKQKGLD